MNQTVDRRNLSRDLLIVAVVAVIWRAVAWWFLSRTPFFDTPVVDASQFDIWARLLAEGKSFQPGAYFKPPLYPHLLSLLYKAGFGLRGVYVLQGLVGVATSLLTVVVGRNLLPRRGALAAGLVVALLPLLPFFEFQLLAESWTTMLTLAATAWLLKGTAGPATAGDRPFAAAGAALGLAALGRPNLLLVIVAAVLWTALVLRRDGRNWLRPALVVLVLAVVVILPTTLRNARESRAFVPISANLGANLVTGNRDRADGVSAIPVGVEWDDLQLRSYQAGHRDPASSSRWLSGQALAWIRANPGRAAGLLGRRLLALVTGWEPRNNIGAAWLAERHGVRVLGRWWPGTWLLLPLAAAGLAAVRWRRAAALLAVVMGAQAVSVLPFFVNARFRLPLLPLLAVFAVVGALALWDLRGRRDRRTLGAALAFVVMLPLVNIDFLDLGDRRRGAEDAFNEALISLRGYGDRQPDPARAVGLLEEAMALDPSFPDAPERLGSLWLQEGQRRLERVRRLLARGDRSAGRDEARTVLELLDRAAAAHQQALAAYPRAFNSRSNLGAAHLLRAETRALLAAESGDEAAAETVRRLASAAAADYRAAMNWFDRALALNPDDRAARENRALAAAGLAALDR